MGHGPADLYFGRDDAEMDIADGGPLRAGFLPTPACEAARKARKHLIIGRKGSGKSAICGTLADQDDAGLVTRLVTPDALSAEEIRRFELQGVEPGLAKRMLWRYVLATYVAKHLVAHAKAAHKKTPSAVARLQAFLVDNGELDVARPELYEIVKRLKGSLKLQAFGVEGVQSGIDVMLGGPRTGPISEQINYIRDFLQELGRRLEAGGFCDSEERRYFIRSIGARVRGLGREAEGFDP